MAKSALEQRVTRLEQQLASLNVNGLSPRQARRRMMAKYADDPDLLELFQKATKIREADRVATRPKERRRKAAV